MNFHLSRQTFFHSESRFREMNEVINKDVSKQSEEGENYFWFYGEIIQNGISKTDESCPQS